MQHNKRGFIMDSAVVLLELLKFKPSTFYSKNLVPPFVWTENWSSIAQIVNEFLLNLNAPFNIQMFDLKLNFNW